MKTLAYLIFIFSFFANFCWSQVNDNIKSKIDTSKIAILPTEKYWGFKDLEAAKLSNDEILFAEKLLSKSVKEYNKGKKYNQIDLKEYYRQYFAAKNLKGEKLVYINCFCGNAAINWKEEIEDVDDGGKCFFQLRINLTKKSAEELDVNGP